MHYLIEKADETSFAAYFVQWTPGALETHGARFDFIVGRWGDGTSATDRAVASLEYGTDASATLRVIDTPNWQDFSNLAAVVLSRTDVLESRLAKRLHELLDAVWTQDDRIRELTGIKPPQQLQ
jgi:hypothetical protein